LRHVKSIKQATDKDDLMASSYILQRLILFVLTVWLGATMIFIIPRLAPGDPISAIMARMIAQGNQIEGSEQMVEAWRVRFGLDQPLMVQYVAYLRNMLRLDLGYSLTNFPSEVIDLVGRSLPWTIGLLLLATVISFILGNLIGVIIAWRRTPGLIRTLLPLSMIFTSIPFYMLGILLIYLFSVNLHWFPTVGAYSREVMPGLNWPFMRSVIHHGVLPAAAIIIASMGFWALGMRGMMITTAGEDYMLLADAKGLPPYYILWRYGVRNAILPQVTALSLSLGGIAGGSVLVELLFSYPGMGFLLYQAILNNDYTLLQGIAFIMIVGTALGAFLIDMLYPVLDPRISYVK
jgi:peptide/nickel transport system permease protein